MNEVSAAVWHIVHTNPRSEIAAACRLGEAGYRAFAPHCYVSKVRDRRAPHIRHLVRRQVFSRYVFLGVINPEQGLWAASHCAGVQSLLKNGDKPAVVSPRFMAAMFARCEPDGWMREADDNPTVMEQYQIGQKVRITFGPLENLIVSIARLDGRSTADVEVEMFGASRPVNVPLSGIAAVEA
ncbi:hypothetical protein L1787_13030 [Acuticoccus sp. M5D2P5]|uniref:transcription termination/antitermination protein NusG n=1 Tax=Acuticoccus kalidii TaxID=2910977 RepID=UPI001F3BB240|nr:hypothetical protein [Acuticoccus kalidii]